MSCFYIPHPRLRGAIQPLCTVQSRLLTRIPLIYRETPDSIRQMSSSASWSGLSTPSTFISASRLSGKTCMVTGGTSGIGFAIAERFLQEGAKRVVLVGRSQERLSDAARRLEGSVSNSSSTVAGVDDVTTQTPEEDSQQNLNVLSNVDGVGSTRSGSTTASSDRVSLLVGDIGDAGSWTCELEKEMEPIDILVNAAGISISKVLPKTEPGDITQILRTNLEGAILTSRALMRASIRSRVRNRNKIQHQPSPEVLPSKCIINVSSLLALRAGTGAVPYAASKAGILGLTRSIVAESANSLRSTVIRSNTIVPGYIETPMIADFSENEVSRLKSHIPLQRFGDPQEVADAAVFLAQNEYANNCVLNLDGGLSAV